MTLNPIRWVLAITAMIGQEDTCISELGDPAEHIGRFIYRIWNGIEADDIHPTTWTKMRHKAGEDPVLIVGREPIDGTNEIIAEDGIELFVPAQVPPRSLDRPLSKR